MKAYTDIEQSKKLAKILPFKSADMYYREWKRDTKDIRIAHVGTADELDLPCWSLAALLSVLPMIDFTTPQLVGTPKTLYRCMYDDNLKSHACDNPIDACVEMILKLNKLNLL